MDAGEFLHRRARRRNFIAKNITPHLEIIWCLAISGDCNCFTVGFEEFFSIIESRGLLATDLEALTAVAEEVGLEIVGPPLSQDEVDTILAGGDVDCR